MHTLYGQLILALWLLVSPVLAHHTVFVDATTTSTTTLVTTTIPSTTSLPSVTSTTSTSVVTTTSTSTTTSTTVEPLAVQYAVFGPIDGFPWNIDFAAFPAANNELLCTEWTPSVGITGADRVGWFVNSGISGTVGFAIYNYDGSTEITEGMVTGSGQIDTSVSPTPFNVSPGTQYRVCFCTTDRTIVLYDTGQNTTEWDNVGRFSNMFLTKYGIAANSCSSGDPPSTTGALTPPGFDCVATSCGAFPTGAYYGSSCSADYHCDGNFPLFMIGSSTP